uniref:Nuclear respiratory factor 1 NLS/DNA-binding dimerisation domain-containing protein n=1 Tax=Glossina austeni TaxID=7395 RepID=A0A1A9UCR7_GLOAU
MDEHEELQQNNMISNLPLLFANGYPTSLEKITESQLETFIPFMVQCSLGHINLQGKIDCSEPEWWPEDLPFSIPLIKPKKFKGSWIAKLKDVVLICYQFHKSVFLLRFCNDLSLYEHASLRFINNYNSTTSLFDRRSNKLLVTFRNENMSYDQPQRLRKCLLQQKSKNGQHTNSGLQQQIMVEPAPFDIYLCDNCDAELYSTEAILEHEKTCSVEDEVILCDTPEPADIDNTKSGQHNVAENNELRIGFLMNFNLKYKSDVESAKKNEALKPLSHCSQEDNKLIIAEKNRRISRRNRTVHSMSRCSTIPLSSPAGQLLLRTTKSMVTCQYLSERLERVERFCHAPILSKTSCRPKYLEKKFALGTPHCSFKKPAEYSNHLYVFPRRQFSQKRRSENFRLLNSTLLRRCRPISVRLKKIGDSKLKMKHNSSNCKLNIKLTRDNPRSSHWKISSSPSTEIIVDTIDLCTSDEEENVNKRPMSPSPTLSDCNNVDVNEASPAQIKSELAPNVTLLPIPHSSVNKAHPSQKSHIIQKNDNTSFKESVTAEPKAVKPLRPPVYILHNYVPNPLAAAILNATSSKETQSSFQKQPSSKRPNITSNTIISTNSMWFSSAGNSTHDEVNCEMVEPASTLLLDAERRSHNLPTVLPTHIISIDLTS